MIAGEAKSAGCKHTSKVPHYGHEFCGRCGKGMSEGAPEWIRPELAPGYKERVVANRAERRQREKDRQQREETYDLSGIFLDWGITGLSDDELACLLDVCTRESEHRAKAPADPS